VEVSPEAAVPVLQDVVDVWLASPVRGLILRHARDVRPDALRADRIRLAERYPVFERDADRAV
jgi:hypothetical protein